MFFQLKEGGLVDSIHGDIKILNCENVDCAISSVADIFSISDSLLIGEIESWEPFGDDSPLGEDLLERLCSKFGIPKPHLAVYFHGTRIGEKSSFTTEGIKPKSLAAVHFGGLYDGGKGGMKDNSCHEGPFGFLINELHYEYHYTKLPELIQDAGSKDYIEQFINSTKPCIIAFLAEPPPWHLETAVRYLYLKFKLGDLDYLGSNYDSKGRGIPPDRILSIDDIVIDLVSIRRLARSVRKAFESQVCDDYSEYSSLRQSIFPKGCCGDVSRVLAAILYEDLNLTTEYWSGYYQGQKSHAWLQVKDYVIDITADQFNDYSINSDDVIVSNYSKWHRSLSSKECHGAGNALRVNSRDYKLIKSAITEK